MTQKSPVRTEVFDSLEFAWRFEYGDMARVCGICGIEDGTTLGVGWGEFIDAEIPWTIRYDEVLAVFTGQLTVHTEGRDHVLNSRDAIWLPERTALIYRTDYALVHFAIHPANWADKA